MDFLPTDWKSFIWGVAVGGLGAIFSGFLKKFGEDAYVALKARWFPKPPEPTQVEARFAPPATGAAERAWVPESRVGDYEAKDYSYYPHRKTGGKCFRVVGEGSSARKEFLMVAPDATKTEAS